MRIKKRLTAMVCLLAALVILALPWTAQAAYEDVYLVGVNDTVLLGLINSAQMPVRRSGTVYVPCTVLDNRDLNLSYALNRTGGTFTVFDRKETLIFQLNGSGATNKDGATFTDHIITRNGVVFVPLRFIARHFGLTYSFYNVTLPDGNVPIARVCTQQAALSNQQFATSVAQLVQAPLAQYQASQATPSPTPTQRPAASPEPSPSAQPDPVSICFAVACTDGGGFQILLDSFAQRQLSALFLFSPDDLPSRDADVRAAAAAGHQIGLLLGADDPAGDFRRGNDLLGHILRAETAQVSFPKGSEAEGDWWVWRGNVNPRGGSTATQAVNMADDVDRLRLARVTLNDSRLTALAFQRNLRTWSRPPYTLFTPTEAD